MALVDETYPEQINDGQLQVVGELKEDLPKVYVPIASICLEDVSVNDEHVEALASSILAEAKRPKGGTGQISPIVLAKVEGEELYRIIDGFHRCAALSLANIDMVLATIRESTWEDITDLRILTARTHKTVQFSRIIDWINEAWERTPWAPQINANQAFVLALKTSSHKRTHFNEAEIAEIKDWVKTKCTQWHVSASSVYNHLTIGSLADPELVKEARHSEGGGTLQNITPGHLGVIAKGLPFRFDLQQLVAQLAKEKNLTIPETRAIVGRVAYCEDVDEASQLVASINWSALRPVHSESRQRQIRAANFGAMAVKSSKENVLQPAHVAIANAKDLLEKVNSNPSISYSAESLARAKKDIMTLAKGLFDLTKIIDTLIERVDGQPSPSSSTLQEGIWEVERVRPSDDSEEVTSNAEPTVTTAPDPYYMRTHEVAALFDVTSRTVLNWIDSGRLRGLRTAGGHLRYRREDIEEVLRQNSGIKHSQ